MRVRTVQERRSKGLRKRKGRRAAFVGTRVKGHHHTRFSWKRGREQKQSTQVGVASCCFDMQDSHDLAALSAGFETNLNLNQNSANGMLASQTTATTEGQNKEHQETVSTSEGVFGDNSNGGMAGAPGSTSLSETEVYLSSDSATSLSSSRASSNRDEQEGLPFQEREIGTQTSIGSKQEGKALTSSLKEDENNPGGAGRTEHEKKRLIRSRSQSRSDSQSSSSGGDSEEFYVDNPTPQIIPPPVETGAVGEKHVIVMVGLPARGKTHMARRLARYLAFFHGARTKVFNVGEYRRLHMSNKQCSSDFFDHKIDKNKQLRASFAKMAMDDMIQFLFEDRAQQQIIKVESMENMSLSDMHAARTADGDKNHGHGTSGLGSGMMSSSCGHNLIPTHNLPQFSQQKGVDSGKVAFFDATNTTKARRKWIYSQLEGLPLKVIFIESICTDEQTIEKNIWDSKVLYFSA